MKTLQFVAVFAFMVLLSCSSDDTAVVAPSLSFNDVNFETSIFTEGATETPNIEWNGDVGTLSLGSSIPGVSINASDGTISWDKSLPLGLHEVQLMATNSAGTKSINIEIDNRFAGDFIGGYNTDPESESLTNDFQLMFNADGTMSVIDDNQSIASGTWLISGTSFTSVYTYDDGDSTYSLVMDIIHSGTEAYIKGYWYDGDDPVTGSERGFLKLDL